MLVFTMVLLGLLALIAIGLAFYEGVTTAKGTPSPKLNWVRPVLGPLALAIMAIWALMKLNSRRKQLAGRKVN